MPTKITDKLAKSTPTPEAGQVIIWDTETPGFGLRITAAGARTFVFRYRLDGLRKKMAIGRYGTDAWTVAAARKRAGELRRQVDRGNDPLAERIEKRDAKTVAAMCARFQEEFLPKKRPTTQRDYRAIIANDILPAMRNKKVTDVKRTDVDDLHRKITKRGAPYRANRTVALLAKMFSLAIYDWEWRPVGHGNPARRIERNQETKRHRYLSPKELDRLTAALAEHSDQQAANIIRLLMLTGARRGEVQAARWDQFDLEVGVWTKPGATTKQKTEHRVPLSAPARQLLSELRETADEDAEYVFPGRLDGHRVEIKYDWAALCKVAKINNARIHDLRHTYASVLASAGQSLPVIGALLGHSQPATTARYSHLFDDPLRAATERAGAVVTGKKAAEVISLRKSG